MEIFADDPIKKSLEHVVDLFNYAERPGSIILIEMKVKSMIRTGFDGFDIALDRIESGEPVIITGIAREWNYAEDQRWHTVLAYPNARFVDALQLVAALPQAYEEASQAQGARDELAICLGSIRFSELHMGILRHDVRYARSDESRREQWMQTAQKVFGHSAEGKSFEEMATIVEADDTATHLRGQLAGKFFQDICVDVEGTLLNAEGGIRSVEFVRSIQDMAKEEQRPITIMTGGKVSELNRQLRSLGLTWKIASKYDLAGAAVNLVLDDLPREDFQKEYNIGFDRYIQVGNVSD